MRLYLSPHDLASVITGVSVLIGWGGWNKVRLLPHMENLATKFAEELGWALRGIVRAELCPMEMQHCFPIPCRGCVANIHSLWERVNGNMFQDLLVWLCCCGKYNRWSNGIAPVNDDPERALVCLSHLTTVQHEQQNERAGKRDPGHLIKMTTQMKSNRPRLGFNHVTKATCSL